MACTCASASPEDEKVLDLLLAQRIVTEGDVAAVPSKVREAQTWQVRSVLTHYDNRLDNIVVEAGEITVLDWGLSFAGIGIEQELIKLFESAPMSTKNPRAAAFLYGYGLSEPECVEAIKGGQLMLVGVGGAGASSPDQIPLPYTAACGAGSRYPAAAWCRLKERSGTAIRLMMCRSSELGSGWCW